MGATGMPSRGEAHLPAISVVIPAYNEEKSISAQIREVAQVLERSGRASEIIVVDDGSTDGTGEEVHIPLIRRPAKWFLRRLAMLLNGYRVAYEPVDYRRRVGSSKIRPTDTVRFLIQILRVSLLFQPRRVYLPLGAVVAVVGGLMLICNMLSTGLSGKTAACLLGALLIWRLGLPAHRRAQRIKVGEPQ